VIEFVAQERTIYYADKYEIWRFFGSTFLSLSYIYATNSASQAFKEIFAVSSPTSG
jgi:hypothetical protein